MAKITPVYYLEAGTVKFWQQEGATASATVVTPNAIVAKKQSNIEISYNPYEKHTVVAVYKGEAEIADLGTGKKMLLKPADGGKPRVAIVGFSSASASSKPTTSSPPIPLTKSSSGLSGGILLLIIGGFIVVTLAYIILLKRSYIQEMYRRMKTTLFDKKDKRKDTL